VGVRVLDELRRPAVALEDGGHEAVVAEVLLAGAAGDGDRDALDVSAAPAHPRDEARDAGVPLEPGLVRIEPASEEAAGLEEEAAEDARPRPVRVEGGQRTEAGLSQAYLTFKPMRGSKLAFSARAGLMWPPISLEHEGADWHVGDSITPSAINSWIGEEVRPVAAEATLATDLGEHKLRATAALMAANDTSGTLLTFRGWALHDRTTLAFRRQPLPPLEDPVEYYQAPYTHPLLDVGPGFAHRPGYYAKIAWQPPVPVRVELFRYDNRADPEAVNEDLEWGWRTWFDNISVVADLGSGAELKAQAMQGRTRMGTAETGERWINNRFRSAFLLLTRPFGRVGLSARLDLFDTRNRGSDVREEYDDKGWSAMLAAKREWGRFTGLVELLHVSSRREDREEAGLDARQHQTQLQAELRMRW